jgi:hypothetical protein
VKHGQVEHLGVHPADERGVRGGGHAGELLQERDVLGMPAELVVAHQAL